MSLDPSDSGPTPDAPTGRLFHHEGVPWIARIAGAGVAGTGRFAAVALQLLRFTRSGEDLPEREAATALRSLEDLHDTELAALLEGSQPIEPPDSRAGEDDARSSARPDPADEPDEELA